MQLAFGKHQLDAKARTLQRDGQRVHVEPKVFDLLVYLIEHRERVASTNELLDALWPGVSVTPAALSRAVEKARQAVGDDGEQQAVLRTEHGRGFRFVAEVSVVPAPGAATQAPTGFRTRWITAAGVAALLLVAVVAWLLNRPLTESAPGGSVAVLPFANMSQDAANEPFTIGIYDDILTHISKIRDLKVIARTSMERLDPNLNVKEIGTILGVATVLEGGVQRVGDRVRINVQLNDCETEAHLWSETYDRELTAASIFAIQSEIATSVANALQVTLSEEDQVSIASAPTENLAAYDAYLLGQRRWYQLRPATTLEAVDYFQQAIALDPSYALAYVGLADSYLMLVVWGSLPLDEGLAKAQTAADKALALDDRLGEAYSSLGGIKGVRGDFEGAEAAHQRAIQLNPNYATAYNWYGYTLWHELGRNEEALSMYLKAVELDPISGRHVLYLAAVLSDLGRYEEALAWRERAVELDPTRSNGIRGMGFYHLSVTGKLDQAVVWYRRAISLDPAVPSYPADLGATFLDLGDLDTATYWIDRAIELGRDEWDPNRLVRHLRLYRNDEAALMYARKWYLDGPFSSAQLVLRDQHLSKGRYSEARALYEKACPELFDEDDPQVGFRNWGPAINLAAILFKTGEQERADLLLEKSLRHIQTTQRRSHFGYELADVEIFALRGEKQKALSALRQAIDEGWRSRWWYFFKHNPNLESLHDDPEFQAMAKEIEADMAAQLARVREMERAGELAAIPRTEVSLH